MSLRILAHCRLVVPLAALVLVGAGLSTAACSSQDPYVPATTDLSLPDGHGDGGAIKTPDGSTPTDSVTQPQDSSGPLTDGSGGVKDGGSLVDTGPTTGDGGGKTKDVVKPPVDAGAPDAGPKGPVCKKPSECAPHKATPYCKVLDGVCVECITNFHCKKAGQTCTKNNNCANTSCVPKSKDCIDGFPAKCADDGKGWLKSVCPEAAPHCIAGDCRKCIPNENYCATPAPGQTSSKLLMKCNESGTDGDVVLQCGGATVCLNGKCGICTPGLKKCDGFKAMACKPDGSGWAVEADCAAKDLACLGGLCVDPCGSDIKSNTNVGCDYWGVDLDNAQVPCGPVLCDAQNMQYSIIISNTKTTKAEVTITTGAGKSAKYQVPGGDMKVINLPDPAWGGGPLNQNGSSINNKSYRIHPAEPARDIL